MPRDVIAGTGITFTVDGGGDLTIAVDPSLRRLTVSATRDLAASDNGATLYCTGTITLTVPSGLPDNFQCAVLNVGTGIVTISQGASVTMLPGATVTLDNTGTANLTLASVLHSTGNAVQVVASERERATIIVPLSDETTDLTTGTGKFTMRMPFGMVLTAVRANVNTAPTGATIIVDINENGTSILGTKLSIDASEKTSTTAASAATITDTNLADDAEITFDIDQVGSTVPGKGLKVTLIGFVV